MLSSLYLAHAADTRAWPVQACVLVARGARCKGRLPALARARHGEAAPTRIHRVRERCSSTGPRPRSDSPSSTGSRKSTMSAGSCVRCCARGAQTRMPITASACTRSWTLAGRTLPKQKHQSLHSSSRAWRRSWPRRGACTMFKGLLIRVRQTRSTGLTLRLLQSCTGTGDDCAQRRGGAFQAGIHARRVCAQLRSTFGDGAQNRCGRDCSLGASLAHASSPVRAQYRAHARTIVCHASQNVAPFQPFDARARQLGNKRS